MPNKATAFYTTDEKFVATVSNHLYGHKYNREGKVLTIQFYNGATYSYFGVDENIVKGMELSPSHGTFFHHNIKQVYPKQLLGKKPLGYLSQLDNPYYELFPDLAKLDKLDEQELKIRKQHDEGGISSEEFHRFMDVLELKKEKVITKLEKDGYSFDDLDDSQDPGSSKGTGWGNVGSVCKGLLAALGAIGEVTLIIMKGTIQIMGMFIALGAILGSSRR